MKRIGVRVEIRDGLPYVVSVLANDPALVVDLGREEECPACGRCVFEIDDYHCVRCEGCPDCEGTVSSEDNMSCLDCGWTL